MLREIQSRSPKALQIELLAAAIWGLGVLAGAIALPIFSYGGQPDETFYDHTHAFVVVFALVGALLLTICWLNLKRRIRTADRSLSVLTIVTGCVLAAFSVFGWVPGFLTIGIFGILLAGAGRSIDHGGRSDRGDRQ
jgi:hypothetical protein